MNFQFCPLFRKFAVKVQDAIQSKKYLNSLYWQIKYVVSVVKFATPTSAPNLNKLMMARAESDGMGGFFAGCYTGSPVLRIFTEYFHLIL